MNFYYNYSVALSLRLHHKTFDQAYSNSGLYLFAANANCDATCGKSFNGMQVEIMDPNLVSGDGEIVIHSRNVFMGYAKVCDYHNYQNRIPSNLIYTVVITIIYNCTTLGRT